MLECILIFLSATKFSISKLFLNDPEILFSSQRLFISRSDVAQSIHLGYKHHRHHHHRRRYRHLHQQQHHHHRHLIIIIGQSIHLGQSESIHPGYKERKSHFFSLASYTHYLHLSVTIIQIFQYTCIICYGTMFHKHAQISLPIVISSN